MHSLSTGFAVVGAACGGLAAWYWYRSARVEIDPGWRFEPVDQQVAQMGWIAGIMGSLQEAAKMSRIAASWTAISVACGTASMLIGAFGL